MKKFLFKEEYLEVVFWAPDWEEPVKKKINVLPRRGERVSFLEVEYTVTHVIHEFGTIGLANLEVFLEPINKPQSSEKPTIENEDRYKECPRCGLLLTTKGCTETKCAHFAEED